MSSIQSTRTRRMSPVSPVAGIYKITCLPTRKVYVGSAVDIRGRWKNHRKALRAGSHDNSYLQHAWNKHGERAFRFQVVEQVCFTDMLIEREQHWIDRTKCTDRGRGFNINPTAGSAAGRIVGPETRAKVSRSLKGRPASALQRFTVSKSYIVTSPEGVESTIRGLVAFCEAIGLDCRLMYAVASGRRGSHRGWSCRPSTMSADEWGRARATRRTPRCSRHAESTIDRLSGEWVVVRPDGQEYRVRGLRRFCEANDLPMAQLGEVARGEQDQCHGGWKCRPATMTAGEWEALRASKRKPRDHASSFWQVTFPSGETAIIWNLNVFCREHRISADMMRSIDKGRRNYYRGWQCRKVEST